MPRPMGRGIVVSASPYIVPTGKRNRAARNTSTGTVRWRVELKPGETKNLTYTYERYVRSN